jgi:hypothetical protein
VWMLGELVSRRPCAVSVSRAGRLGRRESCWRWWEEGEKEEGNDFGQDLSRASF